MIFGNKVGTSQDKINKLYRMYHIYLTING